jgi:hypothetical protein
MKSHKTPLPLLLSRARREIAYLKRVLKENAVAIPEPLGDLLATPLPKWIAPGDRRRLPLCLRQLQELRALRDRTCPPVRASHTPTTEYKPADDRAQFYGGGLPGLGKKRP